MIRRKDLVDVGDDDYNVRQGEYMECQDCGETIGGTRGDWFHCPMDWIFSCPNCKRRNIAIVKMVSKIVVVKS